MSDDGWGTNEPLHNLLAAYEHIDRDLVQHPVEVEVREPKDPNAPIQVSNPNDENGPVYYLPPDSDDDDEDCRQSKRVFSPPLQVQRNQYVRNTLKDFCYNKDYKFKKMAVMGCGESSLENFLCNDLGPLGIERVVSIDIEEGCLAKGIRLLGEHLKRHSSTIKNNDRLPVLFEHFLGSILEYDERLASTDCVCSTEVIEHIPVEEAEVFARLVLDKIRPKVFILSTPNHEYNKAFGMEPGQFRHDDHKYEFTRSEFVDWIKTILNDSGDGYKYSIHYVGNINGFKQLQGATQFVTFYREGEVGPEAYEFERRYKKASSMVACHGLNTILISRGKAALKTWLQQNPLLPENLTKTEYAEFWKIPLDQIIDLMNVSPIILDNITREKLLEMLKSFSRGRLFSKYGGPKAADSEHFVVVPSDCRLEIIIGSL